jgi:hypothetical protein
MKVHKYDGIGSILGMRIPFAKCEWNQLTPLGKVVAMTWSKVTCKRCLAKRKK